MASGTLSDELVTVSSPAPVIVAQGGEGQARVSVIVADGFHVQANPASAEFLIPLRLQLRAKGGVRATVTVYPPGEPYRPEGMPSELMTYDGTFEIVVHLIAGDSAQPGDRTLRGVLRYQACDDRSCRVPASVPVSVPVLVVDSLASDKN